VLLPTIDGTRRPQSGTSAKGSRTVRILSRTIAAILLAGLAGGAVAAAPAVAGDAAGYRVLQRYVLGGDGGWDYLTLDTAARRLYVSHGDTVRVIDADSGKPVGSIDGLSGVHGIALAPAMHRGWISNGHSNTVTVFDTGTLKTLDTIKVGGDNPDAILYDPATRRVLTFNGRSSNASAIDASSGKLLATIALPGKPEFAVSDGQGHVYVNIEDKSELVDLDPASGKLLATWSLAPGESPSGLALDNAHHRLFAVCDNRQMIVLDAQTGKRVASVPIGDGPDAAAFDPGRGLVFSSNGQSGTLTVAHQDDPDHYRVVATVPTQTTARTMALDASSGRVYLSAAQFGPHTEQGGPHPHPPIVPNSFTVLVVGQ
jgi:YVTN family beta-propeller protein